MKSRMDSKLQKCKYPLMFFGLVLMGVAWTVLPASDLSGQVEQARQNDGLRKIRTRASRPKQEVDSFLKTITKNDAMIEIIVGQGRLLILQQDLVAQGQANDPIIAIGDPSVVASNVAGPRHLRLTGRRIGVTDLSILTANRENYSFEIHVIADLDYLRGKIRQRFPHSRINLGHVREHVVAEGTARDLIEKQQIVKMIEAYLKSVQADMSSQLAGGTSYSREEQPRTQNKDDEKEGGEEVVSESSTGAAQGQSAVAEVIDLITTPDMLDYLRLELQRRFPGAQLELRYLGKTIVVEGSARNGEEKQLIVNMIKSYFKSGSSAAATPGQAVEQELIDLIKTPPPPDPLDYLRLELRKLFPTAQLELRNMGKHIVVEGQSRDSRQINQIQETIQAHLDSVQANSGARIINMLRVPGPQQVMLKVQIAELNRTALRELGVSAFFQGKQDAVGYTIGGAFPTGGGGGGGGGDGVAAASGLFSLLDPVTGGASTVFGIFDGGDINFFVNALRRNQVLKVLAEPNLVALNGEEASFLAGGRFPVPVPQASGGGGGSNLITIQYEEFGVQLRFKPTILDGDTVRLSVDPSVSSIDFSTGVVIQGTAVPGVSERSAHTVVELREGTTLAIAGLLQIQMEGGTDRIPGLGDLPYIGAMFSNNTTQSVEKELVVLVTPYLVEPMEAEEVPPLPGEHVEAPDDVEFYLKGRIEKRNQRYYRATSGWDNPLKKDDRCRLEEKYMIGPYGYSN